MQGREEGLVTNTKTSCVPLQQNQQDQSNTLRKPVAISRAGRDDREGGSGRPNPRPGMRNGQLMLLYTRSRILFCIRGGAYVPGGRPSHMLSAHCRAASSSSGRLRRRARLLNGRHPITGMDLREQASHPVWADVSRIIGAGSREPANEVA